MNNERDRLLAQVKDLKAQIRRAEALAHQHEQDLARLAKPRCPHECEYCRGLEAK